MAEGFPREEAQYMASEMGCGATKKLRDLFGTGGQTFRRATFTEHLAANPWLATGAMRIWKVLVASQVLEKT